MPCNLQVWTNLKTTNIKFHHWTQFWAKLIQLKFPSTPPSFTHHIVITGSLLVFQLPIFQEVSPPKVHAYFTPLSKLQIWTIINSQISFPLLHKTWVSLYIICIFWTLIWSPSGAHVIVMKVHILHPYKTSQVTQFYILYLPIHKMNHFHNLQFSWKCLYRACLTSGVSIRWHPIFHMIN